MKETTRDPLDLPALGTVFAATRSEEDFAAALASPAEVIFDLQFDLLAAPRKVKAAHEAGKHLFVHVDMARGVGKDESGMQYLSAIGVDGMISTKPGLIKCAREQGLFTVQRCFVVDSRSIETAVDSLRISRPDFLECMPGTVFKALACLRTQTDIPIIAGGLIETRDEVAEAIRVGAAAVSTGKRELWSHAARAK